MTANEKTLATFETRLRQMILRFQELKKENGELYQMLESNEKTMKQLQEQLAATWMVPRSDCRSLSETSISAFQSSAMKTSN